MIKYTYR